MFCALALLKVEYKSVIRSFLGARVLYGFEQLISVHIVLPIGSMLFIGVAEKEQKLKNSVSFLDFRHRNSLYYSKCWFGCVNMCVCIYIYICIIV